MNYSIEETFKALQEAKQSKSEAQNLTDNDMAVLRQCVQFYINHLKSKGGYNEAIKKLEILIKKLK